MSVDTTQPVVMPSQATSCRTETPINETYIMRDLKEFYKSQMENIEIVPEEDDISVVHALIHGPESTPYANGFFYFIVRFPANYPICPPSVKLQTTDNKNVRFNPNLSECGEVCESILGKLTGCAWSPTNTLLTVLLSIQSMMDKNPSIQSFDFSHFPDVIRKKVQNYNDIITHETIRVAVIGMLDECSTDATNMPQILRDLMNSSFKKNYKHFEDLVKSKLSLDLYDKEMIDPFGRNRGNFDYKTLLKKLQDLKTKFNISDKDIENSGAIELKVDPYSQIASKYTMTEVVEQQNKDNNHLMSSNSSLCQDMSTFTANQRIGNHSGNNANVDNSSTLPNNLRRSKRINEKESQALSATTFPDYVMFGTFRTEARTMDFNSEAIKLTNITPNNIQLKLRYNIMIPFIEMKELLYCMDSSLPMILIKPMKESNGKIQECMYLGRGSTNRFKFDIESNDFREQNIIIVLKENLSVKFVSILEKTLKDKNSDIVCSKLSIDRAKFLLNAVQNCSNSGSFEHGLEQTILSVNLRLPSNESKHENPNTVNAICSKLNSSRDISTSAEPVREPGGSTQFTPQAQTFIDDDEEDEDSKNQTDSILVEAHLRNESPIDSNINEVMNQSQKLNNALNEQRIELYYNPIDVMFGTFECDVKQLLFTLNYIKLIDVNKNNNEIQLECELIIPLNEITKLLYSSHNSKTSLFILTTESNKTIQDFLNVGNDYPNKMKFDINSSDKRENNIIIKFNDKHSLLFIEYLKCISTIEGLNIDLQEISLEKAENLIECTKTQNQLILNEMKVKVLEAEKIKLSNDCNSLKRKCKEFEENDWFCAVCLDKKNAILSNGIKMVSTICGHVFCKVCINNALKVRKVCPTCVKPLKKGSGYRELHL